MSVVNGCDQANDATAGDIQRAIDDCDSALAYMHDRTTFGKKRNESLPKTPLDKANIKMLAGQIESHDRLLHWHW